MAVQTSHHQIQHVANSKAQFKAGNIKSVKAAKEPDVSRLEDTDSLLMGPVIDIPKVHHKTFTI